MDLGLIHHSEIESGELPIGTSAEWRCAGITLVYYKFTTTGAGLCKLLTRKQQTIHTNSLREVLNSIFNIH
jgi:hypothetical protein